MSATSIEWAHKSANAAAGCSEARHADGTMSQECAHCYARLQSARMPALMQGGKPSVRKDQVADLYDGVAERAGRGARWTGAMRWDPELLSDAFRGLRPGGRTFLGSMTDLFHPFHAHGLREQLAREIKITDRFPEVQPEGLILLTKRAPELLAWQREHFPAGLPSWVWPGVTAGTVQSVRERVPLLRRVIADVRVVSAEPLLEDISGEFDPAGHALTLTAKIAWVIAGCESGIGRRPSDPAWFRALRDGCVAAGSSFFLKQMDVGGAVVGTPELDGRTWTEVPRA